MYENLRRADMSFNINAYELFADQTKL